VTERRWLIRIFGHDRPRLAAELLDLLGRAGADLDDLEQLVMRERLTLDVLVRLGGSAAGIIERVADWGRGHGPSVATDWTRFSPVTSNVGPRDWWCWTSTRH
jgi:phosphoserine phosphatase